MKKEKKGFRKKVILWLAVAFLYAGAMILCIVMGVIMVLLFLPEVLIAFIIALFRDHWQMWIYPWLKDTVLSLSDRIDENPVSLVEKLVS